VGGSGDSDQLNDGAVVHLSLPPLLCARLRSVDAPREWSNHKGCRPEGMKSSGPRQAGDDQPDRAPVTAPDRGRRRPPSARFAENALDVAPSARNDGTALNREQSDYSRARLPASAGMTLDTALNWRNGPTTAPVVS
jgi:hypothetical protein